MRYILLALAALLIGGCSDGDDTDNRRGGNRHVLPDVHRQLLSDDLSAAERSEGLDATPSPTPTPVATPTPVPTLLVDSVAGVGSEPDPENPSEQADSVGEATGLVPAPIIAATPIPSSPPPAPEPAPATGTLVHNVQLTIYSCQGDSTGAYCPEGNSMYCGKQVYWGAAACRWEWSCGQRFRIVGDPYDMIYTCEDRGGAVTGIDVWFYDYYAPETQAWRNALDGYVTVELLP